VDEWLGPESVSRCLKSAGRRRGRIFRESRQHSDTSPVRSLQHSAGWIELSENRNSRARTRKLL
jgi:hypothetical protein